MSSPKRHVFIALLFILKCFSKSFIIRRWNKRINNKETYLSKPDVETKLQSMPHRHQCPHKEITVRTLGTSAIPTSLPDLDVKQILRISQPPRANRAFKYHKNPPYSPTLARGGGGGGSGFQLISALKVLQQELLSR